MARKSTERPEKALLPEDITAEPRHTVYDLCRVTQDQVPGIPRELRVHARCILRDSPGGDGTHGSVHQKARHMEEKE